MVLAVRLRGCPAGWAVLLLFRQAQAVTEELSVVLDQHDLELLQAALAARELLDEKGVEVPRVRERYEARVALLGHRLAHKALQQAGRAVTP